MTASNVLLGESVRAPLEDAEFRLELMVMAEDQQIGGVVVMPRSRVPPHVLNQEPRTGAVMVRMSLYMFSVGTDLRVLSVGLDCCFETAAYLLNRSSRNC